MHFFYLHCILCFTEGFKKSPTLVTSIPKWRWLDQGIPIQNAQPIQVQEFLSQFAQISWLYHQLFVTLFQPSLKMYTSIVICPETYYSLTLPQGCLDRQWLRQQFWPWSLEGLTEGDGGWNWHVFNFLGGSTVILVVMMMIILQSKWWWY